MGRTSKDMRRMSRDVIGTIPPTRCHTERRMQKYKNHKQQYEDGWYDELYEESSMWDDFGDEECEEDEDDREE